MTSSYPLSLIEIEPAGSVRPAPKRALPSATQSLPVTQPPQPTNRGPGASGHEVEVNDGDPSSANASRHLGQTRAIILVLQVCLVSITTSMTNGLTTIAIPSITTDLSLDPSLIYWPTLVYTLTSGALLLVAGSVADVLGSRRVYLTALFFEAMFGLGCGFSKTGSQLIALRASGGVSIAFILPNTLSLISKNVASGRMRNLGFGLVGAGMSAGWGVGLVVEGILVDTLGWRAGYWLVAGLQMVLLAIGIWALPVDHQAQSDASALKRLRTEIDWVGSAMASASLALLAFVLAQVSSVSGSISQPYIITLLVIGLALIPACALWFSRQERHGQPALIPNSIWKRLPFSTVCVMILFTYAEMATMELLGSLFFQRVQQLPAIQASIRFIPSVIMAICLNFGTGLMVHHVPANLLVLSTTLVGAVSPLLMALIQPAWPYWYAAFPAILLFPLCVDILFTVAILLISEVFPEKDQGLAGAVFNTVGQFGQALGLAIIGVISNSVTEAEAGSDPIDSPAALLRGYRAGFWTSFGWMMAACLIGAYGLKSAGRVGLKRD